MRCSFCYKETPEAHLVIFPKNKPICWYCLDIIQKWETYTYEIKKSHKQDTKKEAE